jgi:hypothetical protein
MKFLDLDVGTDVAIGDERGDTAAGEVFDLVNEPGPVSLVLRWGPRAKQKGENPTSDQPLAQRRFVSIWSAAP